jgi:ABC-type nitrate/sulfonate/bicarbonate transport system substrate-binding protein
VITELRFLVVGLSRPAAAPEMLAVLSLDEKPFARDHPEDVRHFLAGFFEAVHFMINNRKETLEITGKLLHEEPERVAKIYDLEISMLLPDGRFNPKAVDVLKDSFVDLGILPERPKDDLLFTTAFLPNVH